MLEIPVVVRNHRDFTLKRKISSSAIIPNLTLFIFVCLIWGVCRILKLVIGAEHPQ